MRIGIIGLGLMGQAMAENLLAAGHAVAGYDLRPEACAKAAGLGVAVGAGPADAAKGTDLIFLSLMTSEDRRALLWGAQDLASALPEGTVVLDTTTARPEDVEEDHARLAAQGARLVDVCVSGSSQVVRERRALALVGDTRAGAAPYEAALAAFTQARYYFDQPGRGNRAKLIVNTVFGLNRLVLAEALALARDGGFDLETMLDVLRQGETYSVVMDTKGPKMLSGVYEPAVARLAQHAKDVGLILEYAATVGARVPVSEVHHRLLAEALVRGAGPLDNAAIYRAYDADPADGSQDSSPFS